MAEQKVIWADPAPLGLAGFGLTTTVLSLHNLGVVPNAGMTVAYAYAYGGLAQVISGVIDFRRGNIFGGTAFTSYGLFWIGFALLNTMGVLKTGGAELAAWMAMWGVFTFYLAIASYILKARAVTVVLGLLVITFFLLSAAFGLHSSGLLKAAGAEGIATGLSAVYTSAAILINTVSGRPVVPA